MIKSSEIHVISMRYIQVQLYRKEKKGKEERKIQIKNGRREEE